MYDCEMFLFLFQLKNGDDHFWIPMLQEKYDNYCHFMQSVWGPPQFDVADTFLLHFNIGKLYGNNFYQYCEQGQFELANKCCEKDDTGQNKYRFVNCCEKGYFEMAQWMYGFGIELDSNKCGSKTVEMCCKNGHFEMVKWLCSLEPKFNIDYCKAFTESCKNGKIEIAKWLHSSQPNATIDYCEAFAQSCHKGSLESAKWLHNLIDTKKYYNTAFMLACIGGNTNIIKWLHSIGVDIHIGNDWAVRLSCRNGDIDMAKILFELGANIHVRDEEALSLSCVNGHFEIVTWLYSLGADICTAISNKKIFGENFYFEAVDVFSLICLGNHFKITEFIHSLRIIDSTIIENSFVEVCKKNDTPDMAKWLYSIINDDKKLFIPFKVACLNQNFKTAKWLLSLDSLLIVKFLAPDTVDYFSDEEYDRINNILHHLGYSNQTIETLTKIINKQLLDQYDEIDNDTILHILAKYNRIDDLKRVKHQDYKYISYDIIDNNVMNFSIKYIKTKNARSCCS